MRAECVLCGRHVERGVCYGETGHWVCRRCLRTGAWMMFRPVDQHGDEGSEEVEMMPHAGEDIFVVTGAEYERLKHLDECGIAGRVSRLERQVDDLQRRQMVVIQPFTPREEE